MSGKILDATLVAAPNQHNTNLEKEGLREGQPTGLACTLDIEVCKSEAVGGQKYAGNRSGYPVLWL